MFKYFFLSSQIFAPTGFIVYAVSGHICFVFSIVDDAGDLIECLLFISMLYASIKLTTFLFLCAFVHTMSDMSLSESAPAPCGLCGLEVDERGILCEKCSQWFHPDCQDMEDVTYDFHSNNPDFSWYCTTCGSPNHSVSVIQAPLSSFESSNSFSLLSESTETDRPSVHNIERHW